MTRRQLPGPIYEGLPWFYALAGVFGLVVSYRQTSRALSVIVGALGFLCLLGGVVVWLRRRDFRALKANYSNQDDAALRPDDRS